MSSKKQATDRTKDLPLEAHYNQLVHSGSIKDDQIQRQVLSKLQELSHRLSYAASAQPASFGKLFKKQPEKQPKGLYICGNVGRGKSMLMDLFFTHVNVAKKRRVHFHAFMQEVHSHIHTFRKAAQGDPVKLLTGRIRAETTLLCFDELQATDVADATLLFRLFSGLFDAGITIVSTSNHPPASLYTGGVQRERFNNFIVLLEKNMDVASLSSQQDYRHLQVKNLEQTYYYPLGKGAEQFLTAFIERCCKNVRPQHGTLTVQGRSIGFDLYDQSVGRFAFRDLCENALGPADYLAIAKRLRTLILTDIPKLSPEKRNEAKRFVTLIDALYEHKVKLICTAATPPEHIYDEGDGAFEFKRTVSRLAEMQSAKWGKS